jgi:hypothetical protein
MNIPKSFQILGHKILVQMDVDLKASSGNLGELYRGVQL